MRSVSANLSFEKKEKKRKINCGKTSLKNARKTLEKWKFRKDSELFSSIQYRLSTEFVKYKKTKDFYQKDSRINHAVEILKEKRRLARMETQVKNFEKFQRHSDLYTLNNEIKKRKILEYEKDYRKKEQKSRLIRENELAKRVKRGNEYPKEYIFQRLDDLKQKEKLKKKKIIYKLRKKDSFLIKFKEEAEKQCEMKKIKLENIIKERNYRITLMRYEEDKMRDEKRNEIEKRNDEINNFIYQKELINEKIININDDYSNKYQKYKNRIDDILHKRYLNNDTLNKIKLIASYDPSISRLGMNLYNK